MRIKSLLCCGAAMISIAGTSNAAVINLIDNGFAGTAAQQAQFRAGFQIAAAYWGSILTNNVTINLGVGTAALGTGIIGSTGSTRADYTVANWETRLNATKSGSVIDTTIKLPTLTGGGASFITNGTTVGADGFTDDDTTKLVYDNAATTSSKVLYLNSSVIKAIGGTATGVTNTSIDGNVQFSTNFNFDFDPTDGISANTFDFIGVAIHEIGHALGFVSGVDFLDVYGLGSTSNPNAGTLNYSLNSTSIYSALDMFRYSADPTNLVPGGAALDLSAGTLSGTKYFSIDGGLTALFGNSFSQGRYNGDGQQASHWKDATGANACGPQLGILDPTFCFGQMGEVTGLDLAAYDAMGWNLSVNALTYNTTSTASIFRQFAVAVPEPATWAMMLMGFGLVGGAMRRRPATKVSFAA
ncbi:NF038122 family metalloprotease [Sphingomonas sp. GB1N7]